MEGRKVQPRRTVSNAKCIWYRLARDPVYGPAVVRGRSSTGQQKCDLLRCQVKGSVHGKGVFAKTCIADSEVILMGVGTYVLKAAQTNFQMKYSFDIGTAEGGIYDDVALDLSDVASSNMLRWVNAPCENNSANTVLHWKGPVPFLTACRLIDKGEELLLQYEFP